VKERKGSELKATSFAALALAFSSFGDAFLYPFLPVHSSMVGVPVIWVGLLLSINRFVRILSNIMIVHAFARFGLRSVMIFAAVLAIASTCGYGVAASLFAWILFRVIWGIAFSAMRIGTLGYALQHPHQGIALGISRSLQELGPALSLFVAPVLLKFFGASTIFFLLAAFSLPALYFALQLPNSDSRTLAFVGNRLLHWPSTLNSLTLFSAFIIDGIIVVVLGILFLDHRDHITVSTATALAAFYLGYRRVCLVLLSPAGGWIADRVGIERVFNVSMILIMIGLLIVFSGWIATGACVIFTFYSVNVAVTPGLVSKKLNQSLTAVAENATWRDIGAAVGALAGGWLIASTFLHMAIVTASVILGVFLLIQLGTHRLVLKFNTYGVNRDL
jgi:MFS family permease